MAEQLGAGPGRASAEKIGRERRPAQCRSLLLFFCCSQALAHEFLPAEIAAFRTQHPRVAFDVKVLDHERAINALAAYETDLVLVFRPPFLATFQPLISLEQRLVALMSADHPLVGRRTIRLRDCAAYPVALPDRSIGGRQLLDEVAARAGLKFEIVAESNSLEFLRCYLARERLISFQIEIGAPSANADVVARPIDDRDIPRADLVLGGLRGRNLPVAIAMFAERLARWLEAMRKAQSHAA